MVGEFGAPPLPCVCVCNGAEAEAGTNGNADPVLSCVSLEPTLAFALDIGALTIIVLDPLVRPPPGPPTGVPYILWRLRCRFGSICFVLGIGVRVPNTNSRGGGCDSIPKS